MSWYDRHCVTIAVAVALSSPLIIWAALALKVWCRAIFNVDTPDGLTP